jgi:hypothetical protein
MLSGFRRDAFTGHQYVRFFIKENLRGSEQLNDPIVFDVLVRAYAWFTANELFELDPEVIVDFIIAKHLRGYVYPCLDRAFARAANLTISTNLAYALEPKRNTPWLFQTMRLVEFLLGNTTATHSPSTVIILTRAITVAFTGDYQSVRAHKRLPWTHPMYRLIEIIQELPLRQLYPLIPALLALKKLNMAHAEPLFQIMTTSTFRTSDTDDRFFQPPSVILALLSPYIATMVGSRVALYVSPFVALITIATHSFPPDIQLPAVLTYARLLIAVHSLNPKGYVLPKRPPLPETQSYILLWRSLTRDIVAWLRMRRESIGDEGEELIAHLETISEPIYKTSIRPHYMAIVRVAAEIHIPVIPTPRTAFQAYHSTGLPAKHYSLFRQPGIHDRMIGVHWVVTGQQPDIALFPAMACLALVARHFTKRKYIPEDAELRRGYLRCYLMPFSVPLTNPSCFLPSTIQTSFCDTTGGPVPMSTTLGELAIVLFDDQPEVYLDVKWSAQDIVEVRLRTVCFEQLSIAPWADRETLLKVLHCSEGNQINPQLVTRSVVEDCFDVATEALHPGSTAHIIAEVITPEEYPAVGVGLCLYIALLRSTSFHIRWDLFWWRQGLSDPTRHSPHFLIYASDILNSSWRLIQLMGSDSVYAEFELVPEATQEHPADTPDEYSHTGQSESWFNTLCHFARAEESERAREVLGWICARHLIYLYSSCMHLRSFDIPPDVRPGGDFHDAFVRGFSILISMAKLTKTITATTLESVWSAGGKA